MPETQVKVSGTDQPDASMVQAHSVRRRSRVLFPELPGQDAGEGLLATLMKAAPEDKADASSNKGERKGRRRKPFNFAGVIKFKTHNIHHSTCIEAKKSATVGLGHTEDKVADTLDPLCRISWLYVLLKIAEDYFAAGNGWLEVVRRSTNTGTPDAITGLHHVPMCDVEVNIEDDVGNMHYEVRGDGGTGEKKFAVYGDKKDFIKRLSIKEPNKVSELIHFPEPSSLSRHYGFPSWIAAVSSIELVQAMVQHQFDFHLNRGVPEFMLFILGQKVGKDNWKKITDSLDATVGLGNSHKTFAVNLEDPDISVQLEKLAMEGVQDGAFFKDMMETLALAIVSAHRVPPSIAGILIPGKMGAANEMSNAIMAFQSLVIGQAQQLFETILGCTLGNEKLNGGLGLGRKDFNFVTIVDEIAEQMEKLKPVDTMGRMRDELGDAATEGRDLDDGLQKVAKRVGELLIKQWKDENSE